MADPWMDGLTQFHAQRERSIGGEEGWSTVVGLEWIPPGKSLVGAGSQATLKLPEHHAPDVAMTLVREGDKVHATVAKDVTITVNGARFTEGDLVDDRDGRETVLKLGSLTMRIIKRGDRIALRVKDPESPARKAFHGLTFFDPDPSLHVKAKLVATPGKTLKIANVLGQNEDMPSPGVLHFSIAGKPYTLDAVQEKGDDQLFILFRDASAGKGTYPSGRFLYAPLPDGKGEVDLDFNRAFSPPCAFTAYATCPLPPAQNVLPIAIWAGEKYTGHH